MSDLNTGSEVLEDDCQPVKDATLGLPTSSPLDFSDSGPWGLRLPHSDKVERITNYIERGITGDEDKYDSSSSSDESDRILEICNSDFGDPYSLLALSLEKGKKDDGGGGTWIQQSQDIVLTVQVSDYKFCLNVNCNGSPPPTPKSVTITQTSRYNTKTFEVITDAGGGSVSTNSGNAEFTFDFSWPETHNEYIASVQYEVLLTLVAYDKVATKTVLESSYNTVLNLSDDQQRLFPGCGLCGQFSIGGAHVEFS